MAATDSEHLHHGVVHDESHGGISGGHHPGMWVFPDPRVMTRDMAGKVAAMPAIFAIPFILSFILLVLGVIGFVARAIGDGFDDRGAWGYYMASFSFVFMVTSAAPIAAIAFRFTKSHWRRPLSRLSELFAVVGIFNVIAFIPMMFVLPPIANPGGHAVHQLDVRRTIWFEGPIGAPHAWDLLGVVFLAVTALVILWISAMPDMAEGRVTATGIRRWIYRRLAGHWYGTKRQWNAQKAGLAMLGAFYFMTLVFVQFIISSDYAQSMIPGWKDAIFPVFYTLTGFQVALGSCLIILYIMRRWGGYHEYYGKSVFWSASKVQLGLTLLWAYHLFSFFITYWYGRLVVEQNIIKYLFGESYGGVFAANLALSFFIPFLLLLWNPVRRSAWGPPLAGLSALLGALMFSVRVFVGGANSGNIYAAFLDHVPSAVYPDIWDIFMVIGGIGGAIFVYLLATRILPVLSVWEVKEGALYQRMSRFIRGEYLVLAKPE
jgi:molybdopterin-containing oxidoreductase family membrane subunit